MAAQASPAVQGTISGSTLVAGGGITTTNTYNSYGFPEPDPLAILQHRAALGALYNAAERPDPPKCHPETRMAILGRLDRWARDTSDGAKPILWLSGAAGAGKSAIAQTSIERWLKEGFACPNFFYWRTSEKRNVKTHLLPTIAYQLAQMFPPTKSHIVEATRDGTIFEQNLQSQVQQLVVAPLLATQEEEHSIVIVIDGLDECCVDLPKSGGFPGQTHEGQQQEILESIAFACQQVPSLRILVACRPERQIRTAFSGKALKEISLALSLNNEEDSSADIALYLDCQFADIRDQYPGIEPTWPSREQITLLVEKSSGQFIYPSTVVRYISRRRQYPVRSLEDVLALRPKSGKGKSHPLAELDALYTLVLMTVDIESLNIVKTLLGMMCYLSTETRFTASGLSLRLPDIFWAIKARFTTSYLSHFLFLTAGELLAHLTDLHSVLSIPTQVAESTPNEFTEISFLHVTLSEYLQDTSRSRDFFIPQETINLEGSALLLKHAQAAQASTQLTPSDRYYLRQPMVSSALADFLDRSPPSIDHMTSLWATFKGDIGDYSSNPPPNMASIKFWSRSSYGEAKPCIDGPFFKFMEPKDQLKILLYLRKCNIVEVQPSEVLRRTTDSYLTALIISLGGSDQIITESVKPRTPKAIEQNVGSQSLQMGVDKSSSRESKKIFDDVQEGPDSGWKISKFLRLFRRGGWGNHDAI